MKTLVLALALCSLAGASATAAFEGRIRAALTGGGVTQELLFTAGTNFLRVEIVAARPPDPVDVVNLGSGALTLLYPRNRGFVRISAARLASAPPPAVSLPDATPARSPAASKPLEFKATGETTNLLGFTCARYELHGQEASMVIWATDQLLPYHPYLRGAPPRFGPRSVEEQWPGLLAARRLFPLRASLRYGGGAERAAFVVESVTPERLSNADAALFQPPDGYAELQPPF